MANEKSEIMNGILAMSGMFALGMMTMLAVMRRDDCYFEANVRMGCSGCRKTSLTKDEKGLVPSMSNTVQQETDGAGNDK